MPSRPSALRTIAAARPCSALPRLCCASPLPCRAKVRLAAAKLGSSSHCRRWSKPCLRCCAPALHIHAMPPARVADRCLAIALRRNAAAGCAVLCHGQVAHFLAFAMHCLSPPPPCASLPRSAAALRCVAPAALRAGLGAVPLLGRVVRCFAIAVRSLHLPATLGRRMALPCDASAVPPLLLHSVASTC